MRAERCAAQVGVRFQTAKNLRGDFRRGQVVRRGQHRLQRGVKLRLHFRFDLTQQIVHVGVMRIKRAAVDLRPRAEFLYGDAPERLFRKQRGQRASQQAFCRLYAVSRVFHIVLRSLLRRFCCI